MVSPTNLRRPSPDTPFNDIADDITILEDLRDTHMQRPHHDDDIDIYNAHIQRERDRMQERSNNYNLERDPRIIRFMEENPIIISEIIADSNITNDTEAFAYINQLIDAEESSSPSSSPSSPTSSPPSSFNIVARGNKKNKTKTKKCCPKKCCSNKCRYKRCRSKKCCSKKSRAKKCRTKKCSSKKCCSKK